MVDDAQRCVAVFHFIDDDAQSAHVVNLGKRDILLAHLVPDAVDVFWSAVDLGVADTRGHQFSLQAVDCFGDELLALGPLLVKLLGNFLVDCGMQKAEGEVLEFPLQLPDTEPVGERRIQRQRLARHRDTQLVGFSRIIAQGLGARGQTQQDDANVLDHGQQHLAQHLDLRLHLLGILFATVDRMRDKAARDRSQAVQAGNPVDQLRDAGAEVPLEQRQTMLEQRRHGEKQRRQS